MPGGLELTVLSPSPVQLARLKPVWSEAVREAGLDPDAPRPGEPEEPPGGLERLALSVPDGTDGVIVALGANDMLRGLDPSVTRRAIEGIVKELKARDIPAMLAGMVAARNLGPDYVKRFDALYPEIAAKHGLVLYPFFLEGIAGDRSLNLPDGLHPTAKGVEVIVERILPTVETFLARLQRKQRAMKNPGNGPRHHDVGPAEHRDRRPCADG